MDTDWENRIEMDMDFALRKLQSDGGLPPLVVIEAKNEPLRFFNLPFGDTAQKRTAQQLVLLVGVAYNAEAISLLNEVWVATEQIQSDKTSEQQMREARPPSEREDRKEAVMCLILYRDPIDGESRRSVCEIREIERGADGKITRLLQGEKMPDDTGVGPMMNMMLPTRPSPEMQRQAKVGIDELLRRSFFKLNVINVGEGGHA